MKILLGNKDKEYFVCKVSKTLFRNVDGNIFHKFVKNCVLKEPNIFRQIVDIHFSTFNAFNIILFFNSVYFLAFDISLLFLLFIFKQK